MLHNVMILKSGDLKLHRLYHGRFPRALFAEWMLPSDALQITASHQLCRLLVKFHTILDTAAMNAIGKSTWQLNYDETQ